MRTVISLLFLFQFFTGFAQKEFAILDLTELKNSAQEIYSYTNDDTGKFAAFVRSNKQIIGFYFNDQQEILDTIKVEATYRELDIFIGGAYHNDTFTLFFSNGSESKYSALQTDFELHDFKIIEDLGISNKNERVIAYTEAKSQVHMLTVFKNSSVVNLKSLASDGSIKTTSYDLSAEKFETDNGLPLTFESLLFAKKSENPFQTINTDIPNSLEQTSAVTKIYQQKDHIKLTNNTYKKHTYIIDFNYGTETYSYNRIENPNFDKKHKKSNANSFLIDHWFFDTYSTTDGITLNVYDKDSLQLKKTFSVIPGDSIAFKNSPIIHDDGISNTTRDFEKTARFVRRVNSSNIAVAVHPFGDQYVLTLGATQNKPNFQLMVMGAVLGGAVGAMLFSAFDAYGRTESTRITCLFDKDFNHVTGAVPPHSFDTINTFTKENKLDKMPVQTIFKRGDSYVWGYYHKAGNFYRFHQFN